MQISRMFSTDKVKGTREYLNSQKKYELIRTIIYFLISLSLFIAGYISTGERLNLLSVVAALGCLPACKSLVDFIMFFRFKSCDEKVLETIEPYTQNMNCLYDMVFTSYKMNFVVGHMVICGNTVCGFSEKKDFAENDFYKHIGDILKLDGHKDVTVKIFMDLSKYTNRLNQIQSLEADEGLTKAIINTLKSVAL